MALRDDWTALEGALRGGGSVRLDLYLGPSATDRQHQDMEEAAEAFHILEQMPQIGARLHQTDDPLTPRFELQSEGSPGGRIGFVGLPRSLELRGFEEGLHLAATGHGVPPGIAEGVALAGSHHLTVLTSPTCPYCFQAIRLGFQFALASDRLCAFALDAAAFPDAHPVRGLPAVLLDGALIGHQITEVTLLEALLDARRA